MTTNASVPLGHVALVKELVALNESISEFRETLRPVNDDALNEAFREILDDARRIVGGHARRPGEHVADDLANLRSLFLRRQIPREDADLGKTPTLTALRSARGSVLADLESALGEARGIGLVPSDPTSSMPSLGVEIERAGREGQLRALEQRLRKVEHRLTDIAPEGRSDAGHSLQQVGLVNFYVETMKTELMLAKLETRASLSVDLTSLARAIEAIGELTADFVATVEGLRGKVSDTLKHAAQAIRPSVGKVVSGFNAMVVSVRRRGRRVSGSFVPGARFRDFDAAPEMIVVPAGEFVMGSPPDEGRDAERPQHKVAIRNAFAVGVYPVTRGEFAAFIDATGYYVAKGAHFWAGNKWELDEGKSWRDPGFRQQDDHSVVCVSWHDAQAYVVWLRERTGGKLYRLLTEAEWEFCCRAGTTTPYSTGGKIMPTQANFDRNAKGTTSVSKFRPNPWGLHDMHGNVWEWCEDNWHENYTDNPPSDGSVWLGGNSSSRVLRGGSWYYRPGILRSATRGRYPPDIRNYIIGFRVARTL